MSYSVENLVLPLKVEIQKKQLIWVLGVLKKSQEKSKHLKMDYNGIMISGCVAVFVREMCNDY